MEQVCFEAVLTKKHMQKVASLAEDIWYEPYGTLLGEKQFAYIQYVFVPNAFHKAHTIYILTK